MAIVCGVDTTAAMSTGRMVSTGGDGKPGVSEGAFGLRRRVHPCSNGNKGGGCDGIRRRERRVIDGVKSMQGS